MLIGPKGIVSGTYSFLVLFILLALSFLVLQCRVDLERTRLLVLEAADELDRVGNKKARGILAMAKVYLAFVRSMIT